MRPLSRRFFQRDALTVARDLLGRVLVRETRDGPLAARIVETEAYAGPGDKAAHVAGGRRTARTEVFWEPGGVAYVYMVYGMHHCFNVVTGPGGEPSAVLVRAAVPLQGVRAMARRRGAPQPEALEARWRDLDGARPPAALTGLTSGPGRLAAAFGLTRSDTGTELTRPPLFIARGTRVPDATVLRAPRVGVEYAGRDARLLYRFLVKGEPFVSRPWPPAHRRAMRVARTAKRS